MRSLVSFLIGIFLVSSLRAEEKFSMATTPGKLSKDIIPRAYFIHLEPNTDSLVTAGSESIEVEVIKPTDRIVINAVDTEFSQARLSGSHASEELTPQIDSKAETVTFPTKTLLQPGSYQLSLTFRSKITEQPHGLFIQYFRIGDQLERLLSTHMEPTDARRLFPCWDEPAFRAVYQLTVKAKKDDTVMSNMPVAGEQPLGPDEKLVTFDRTPAMASYLFVLACGKLEWVEDEVAGVKLRILTTPGKKQLGRYALEVTKKILPYYNEYFGVQYPLPKLDQIALPSGFGGAMETWGGITYNEDLLLGIRSYMAGHKYSNTTTADLWEALETAAGKPVKDVAASWTEQPGFPLIKVKTQCVKHQQIRLEQARFLVGESDSAPLRWSVLVGMVRVSDPEKIKRVLLDKSSSNFEFSHCDEPIKANAGDVGFFRVSYEPALFGELERAVLKLPEGDRVNLVTDSWATVESGDNPASTYFELLEGLSQDDSYAVWQSIIGFERTVGPLKLINRLERDQPGRVNFENYICGLLSQKLAELTWDQKVGEPIEKRLLRALLIETLGMFGDQTVIEEASRRFASFRENPTSLHPNLRPAVIRIAGRYSSPTDYETLLRLAEESPTSEERRMCLRALSAVRDPELAQRSVEFFISKHVAPGDAGRALEEEALEHPEIVWTYATTHLKQMQQRFGFFRWNRLLPNIATGFTDSERADELVRFAQQNLPAQGQPEADNAANLIRFSADLKKRELPKIDRWVAAKIAQVTPTANRTSVQNHTP